MFFAGRVIDALEKANLVLTLENKRLSDELAARDSVISQFNAALDSAQQLARSQDETMQKQHAVIADYQALLETKVRPLGEFFLRQGRENQGAFALDSVDSEC